MRQALAEAGDDVALKGAGFGTLGFRAIALAFGLFALVAGFALQALGVGKLMAEAFERLGDFAGFVGAILAGNRLCVVAVAEVGDVLTSAARGFCTKPRTARYRPSSTAPSTTRPPTIIM